jgi:hypothetical protein
MPEKMHRPVDYSEHIQTDIKEQNREQVIQLFVRDFVGGYGSHLRHKDACNSECDPVRLKNIPDSVGWQVGGMETI